jgi:hypothetical protein
VTTESKKSASTKKDTRAKKDKKPSAPPSADTKKSTDFEPTLVEDTSAGGEAFIGVSGYWKNRKK